MTGAQAAANAGPAVRPLLRVAAGAAASVFLLAALLRLLQTGPEHPAATVFAALRNLAWPMLLGYVAVLIVQAILRAARYGLLMRAAGDPGVPSRAQLVLATMARNMFVDLLPSRSGELIFVGLLNRVYGVAAATALAALALSFAFDLVGLGAIVLALVAWEAAAGSWSRGMALGGVVFVCLAVAGLVFLLRAADAIAAWGRAGTRAGRVRAAVGHFAAAISSARAAGVLPRVLGLTLAIRIAKYFGLFLVFLAATTRNFPVLAAASPRHVLAALIGSEAAANLPLPTFLGFGAYEAGGTAAWGALGFDPGTAALATTVLHVASQIADYSLGGCGLLVVILAGGRRLSAPVPAPAPARRRLLAGALASVAVLAGAVYAAVQWQGFVRQGALAPPRAGREVAPAGNAAGDLRALLGGRTGFVVWSSNRAGNHDLWRMDLPEGRPVRLTRDPHTENHPRISPDGRQVVFIRSREPWLSLRDLVNWDVWLLDLGSGRERRLAEFGYRPTWAGAEAILFQRRATEVVRLDLRTGAETVVAAAGRGGLPAGTILGDPDLDARSGRLAVTVRGSGRYTAIIEGQGIRRVGGGCQLAWAPDGTWLVQVDDGGRMTNAIYRVDARSLARTLLLDAPEPFSHEYFPALDPGGRFLVYAASAGGHEHDTEDFEVFLWRLGDPQDATVRLTWHTGNDSWPDIFLR